jgi:predicted RNase H-like HicB family nuclease
MAKKVIEDAWELLTNEPNMKRFNFFPSVLSTLAIGEILLYQIAFAYVQIFGLSHDFFERVIGVVDDAHGKTIWLYVAAFVAVYLLIALAVPLCQAGLLALIDKNQRIANGELALSEARREHFYSYALSRGFMKFFPVFELNNIFLPFNIVSIVIMYSWGLRIFGMESWIPVSIVMGIYLAVSMLANILFSYARFFVVFEDLSPFDAIGASIEMAFDNLSETFELYFTVLLLYLRTFFTALVFLVFPFLIFAALSYLSIGLVRTVGIALLVMVFIFFIGLISHLNSVVEIFTQTVWYNTYRENKAEKALKSE